MLNLRIPDQTLMTLSFCDATVKGLEQWADELPKANIGETARQLYHAIIELNQLSAAPTLRMQLLEVVRSPMHFVCTELSKHFLNQSIMLPEKQRKIANLSQALQVHLATGYKIVLMNAITQSGPDRHKKLLAQASHRIIVEFGRAILRANQLYCASPDNIWHEMHQIFCFADAHNLRDIKVNDKEMAYKTESSVESPYKQVLLLGCCKPNQLRQNDLNTLYNVLEHWADQVKVSQKRIDNALFVINMKKDSPPVYRSLVHSAETEQYYGLDTAMLVKQISDYLNTPNPNRRNQSSDGLAMPEPLSDQIMAHLAQSLGVLAKRTFKRIASQGNLLICVGMSATHYYSAGETEFNKFMINASDDEEEGNKFLNAANKKNDAWGGAFDAGAGDGMPAGSSIDFAAGNSEEERKPGYKVYKIPLINTSPGGYCLHWTAEMPGNIQTGEILGVKEPGVEGWSIAAIRWIRQIKQQGTQLGVELLAPTAGPCGIQLLQKTGDNSEFLRALILPELTAIGQPATVITPRLPFQTGQKVMIFENGSSQRCQLVKRVSATGSYSRFEIKYLDGMMPFPDPAPSKSTKNSTVEDDFDSLWPSL